MKLPSNQMLFKTLSIILNCIVGLLIVPIVPVSLMAGVATIMMTDSGNMNYIFMCLIIIAALFFWAMPFIMLLSVILSIVLRKKCKFHLAVAIQVIPAIYGISMLSLLLSFYLYDKSYTIQQTMALLWGILT